jgi:hypothetical protein
MTSAGTTRMGAVLSARELGRSGGRCADELGCHGPFVDQDTFWALIAESRQVGENNTELAARVLFRRLRTPDTAEVVEFVRLREQTRSRPTPNLRRRTTIRTRLTLIAAVAVAAMAVVVCAFTWFTLRQALMHQADQELDRMAGGPLVTIDPAELPDLPLNPLALPGDIHIRAPQPCCAVGGALPPVGPVACSLGDRPHRSLWLLIGGDAVRRASDGRLTMDI